MNKKTVLLLITSVLIISCKINQAEEKVLALVWPSFQGIGALGDSLWANPPSDQVLQQLKEAEAKYKEDSNDPDNLIWYGRRMGYTGAYDKAISIFSEGIVKHPEDPRFYRHRGHRYISIREFDKALDDFDKAEALIQGKPNEIEPDGIPNDRNTPVSSLHGNIYYHQGLAYYLKNELVEAYRSFSLCKTSGSNPDNIVSSSHWLYMIQRRRGMKEKALAVLNDVNPEMDIIENMSYHKLCLLYKEIIDLPTLIGSPDESSSGQDAIDYGIANWHLYNGRQEEGKKLLEDILSRSSWNSFGFIAAETDYARLYQ